jgi:hypothetical protein
VSLLLGHEGGIPISAVTWRAERRGRAVDAATAVARRHGISASRSVVLHDANNIVVHMAPSPIVAKVCTGSADSRGSHKLAAELEVARHLVCAGAPVVGPSHELPERTHSEGGCVMTFWRHHRHDADAVICGRAAARVLQQVHLALDSYPGPLPSFLDRQPARVSRILDDPVALGALSAVERAFLRSEHASILAALEECRLDCRPLHGDPHRGNLLVGRDGCLMIDFESVCSGPLEWDLSALPGEGSSVFDADDNLLALLRRLRRLCVAVWCWTRPARMVELDRVARKHFELLSQN